MGYVEHNAIVVTSWNREHLEIARTLASGQGLEITSIAKSNVNAYFSFLIVPDGSKDGWEDDLEGDKSREKWIVAMREKNLFVDWVEIVYGGDRDMDDLSPEVVDFGLYVEAEEEEEERQT